MGPSGHSDAGAQPHRADDRRASDAISYLGPTGGLAGTPWTGNVGFAGHAPGSSRAFVGLSRRAARGGRVHACASANLGVASTAGAGPRGNPASSRAGAKLGRARGVAAARAGGSGTRLGCFPGARALVGRSGRTAFGPAPSGPGSSRAAGSRSRPFSGARPFMGRSRCRAFVGCSRPGSGMGSAGRRRASSPHPDGAFVEPAGSSPGPVRTSGSSLEPAGGVVARRAAVHRLGGARARGSAADRRPVVGRARSRGLGFAQD